MKVIAGYGLYASSSLVIRPSAARSRPGNVLLFNLNGIGDVLVSTSALRGIRRRFPERKIAFVTHPAAASVLEGNPFIDRVYIHDRYTGESLRRYRAFCREFDPEYSVALNPGYKNAILTCLAPSEHRVWFIREDRLAVRINGRSSMAKIRPRHIGDYAHIAAGALGCGEADSPLLPIDPANRVSLPVHGEKPVVLFIGGKWAWKQWDPKNFALLAGLLAERFPVVVCGGAGDEANLEMVSSAETTGSESITYLIAYNLQQLASVVQQARVLVTTDTVAVHVATSVGSHAVVLFGPTDPERVLPEDTRHSILFKRLPCQPCYSVRGGKRRCSHQVPGFCLRSISVEEVAARVQALV